MTGAIRKYLAISGALVLLAAGHLVAAHPASAARLIMFNSPVCEWCEVWEEQIGVIYHRTPEARRAPLTRVDIDDQDTISGLERRITYTPTFVLLEKGREKGRITGYPGEDFFWGMLEILLKKLEKPTG